jgi:hypothetical protein
MSLNNLRAFFLLSCFAVCIFIFTVNIFFQAENRNLKAQIDKLSEERTNLRARYLSGTALSKLSEHADQLNMVQASKLQTYTVQEQSRETIKIPNLFEAINLEIKKPRRLITGY